MFKCWATSWGVFFLFFFVFFKRRIHVGAAEAIQSVPSRSEAPTFLFLLSAGQVQHANNVRGNPRVSSWVGGLWFYGFSISVKFLGVAGTRLPPLSLFSSRVDGDRVGAGGAIQRLKKEFETPVFEPDRKDGEKVRVLLATGTDFHRATGYGSALYSIVDSTIGWKCVS